MIGEYDIEKISICQSFNDGDLARAPLTQYQNAYNIGEQPLAFMPSCNKKTI